MVAYLRLLHRHRSPVGGFFDRHDATDQAATTARVLPWLARVAGAEPAWLAWTALLVPVTHRTLRLPLLLATAILAAGLSGAAAEAKTTTQKAIWGPQVQDGVAQWPIYKELGVGIFQLQLRWERVALSRPANPKDPNDPAYRWPAQVDEAISGGRPYGVQVLLLVQGAPGWANGGQAWNYPPSDPGDFADFITAAAKRYPQVRRWMIWGEPNGLTGGDSARGNFLPIEQDFGMPLPPAQQGPPRLYARYLDAAYARLKAVSRGNLVIGGNTWTAGAIRPLHFIRAMRLPNGKRPRMDIYGHNPYGRRKPNLRYRPQARGTADFSDLDTLGRAIDRNFGRRPGRRAQKIPIFLSEYALVVDDTFSEAQQAAWIAAGMRIVRRSKRVVGLGIFALYDQPGHEVFGDARWGLLRADGSRKPSFSSFADG